MVSRQSQGDALCIPPNKPQPYTPILHPSPCLPDIQATFLQTALHGINSLFRGLSTERLPAHSPIQTLLAILSFSILSTWPSRRRTPSSILSYTHFVTPQNCLIHSPDAQQTSEAVHLYNPKPIPRLLSPYHCLSIIRKN